MDYILILLAILFTLNIAGKLPRSRGTETGTITVTGASWDRIIPPETWDSCGITVAESTRTWKVVLYVLLRDNRPGLRKVFDCDGGDVEERKVETFP
jgi:hypothetical protein